MADIFGHEKNNRGAVVCQKRGDVFDEKTSFNGLLILKEQKLSFKKPKGLFCATLCIMVKNCVFSRKVLIFTEYLRYL